MNSPLRYRRRFQESVMFRSRPTRPVPLPIVLVLLLASAAAGPLSTQPFLVADLDPVLDSEGSRFLGPAVSLGGSSFFFAFTGRHGRELWASDGTAEGTRQVADVCPGSCSSLGETLTRVGDRLFFVAQDGGVGWGVWSTDGSREGTRLVRRLPPEVIPVPYRPGAAFDGSFWFFATRESRNRSELWVSDGTTAGTAPFVALGDDRFNAFSLVPLGDSLLFYRQQAGTGVEPWTTDGAPGRARILRDICPGECSSGASGFLPVGDRWFFMADDGVHGLEPWITDGTAGGTKLLADLGASGARGMAFDGKVYFPAHAGTALRWWKTDGTSFQPAPELEAIGMEGPADNLFPSGERLFFRRRSTDELEHSLWVLKAGEIVPRQILEGVFPTSARDLGPKFLFAGEGVEPGLWVSDGTAAGTFRLAAVYPGLIAREPTGAGLLFVASRSDREELWVTDGTREATRLVHRLRAPASSSPRSFASLGDDLYFLSGSFQAGALWHVAGDLPGPSRVEDFRLTSSLAAANGRLYVFGHERLAVLTAPGGPVEDLPVDSSPVSSLPFEGGLAFVTGDGGQRLWWTDGTAQGTRVAARINSEWANGCPTLCRGPVPSFPQQLIAAGSQLYFLGHEDGRSDPFDPQLWRSDLTPAGTYPLPGLAARPLDLAAFGDRLAFTGETPEGFVLALTDGTAVGTLVVLEAASRLRELASLGGRLYFVLAGDSGEDELWATDGTAAGTARVSALAGPGGGSRVTAVRAAGDRLFLAVQDDAAGEEPWVSDGTAAGTRRLADLWPGPRGSNPEGLTPYGHCVLFAADDGSHGHEGWASNGVSLLFLGDLASGPGASSPAGFTAAGGFLYFSADDGIHGREPFALAREALSDFCAEPVGAAGEWITTPEVPGYRFRVRITNQQGEAQPVRREADCLGETLCLSGSVPGRSEVFLRVIGPRPNGFYWPTVVRFTTSKVEVWVEREATGEARHYELEGLAPGLETLDGLFDREGFAAQ
jgi:large repetitive protein